MSQPVRKLLLASDNVIGMNIQNQNLKTRRLQADENKASFLLQAAILSRREVLVTSAEIYAWPDFREYQDKTLSNSSIEIKADVP
jgi:hypothetical protein